MIPLVRIESPSWLFELHGEDPRDVRRVGESRSRVHVESAEETQTQVFDELLGELVEADVCGPLFFEDGEYQLVVRGRLDSGTPRLRHRDVGLLKRVREFRDESMWVGTLVFRGHVGYSDFIVGGGHSEATVRLEVFPTKIDYSTDFENLLREIESHSRTLALAFLRSTHRPASLTRVEDPTDLDWLVILQDEMKSLRDALAQVARQPNRTLVVDTRYTPLHAVSGRDNRARRAIIRARGRGEWTTIGTGVPARSEVPSSRRVPTHDTPENRWLKRSLVALDARLRSLHRHLAQLRKKHPRSPNLAKRELTAIEELLVQSRSMLDLQVFVGVGTEVPFGFSSLAMMSAPGYRECYRCLLTLTLGLAEGEGEDASVSLSQVHEIYEIWAFLAILRIVAGLTGLAPGQERVHPILTRVGLSDALKEGKDSQVDLSGRDLAVTMFNNRTYRGLTGDQRPDIVIEIKRPASPSLFLVLDAKYRLDTSSTYRSRFLVSGPPQEAINALHRYRDAIVVEDEDRGRVRPTVRGVALFPLGPEEPYDESPLVESLDVLGVGAIPFLPGNEGPLTDWIRLMLEMPTEQLSVPGPPFAGRGWGPPVTEDH